MATRKAKQRGVAVSSLNDLMRELAREAGCGCYGEPKQPDEFTAHEFGREVGLSESGAVKVLGKLFRDGRVTRRKYKEQGSTSRLWLYKKV